MRLTMMALAGALVLASSAALAGDPMANTYAITVITKNAKTGSVGTLLFNADGSYSASRTGPDGKPLIYPGKWTTKDNGAQICLSPTLPPHTRRRAQAARRCQCILSVTIGT